MAVTVCFDVMGTCFSLDVLVEAVDNLLGKDLRGAGSGPRAVVLDWYQSITSPPPTGISKILHLTLPRSLTFALSNSPSLTVDHLPPLGSITDKLSALTPSPGLVEALRLLKIPASNSDIKVHQSPGERLACPPFNILMVTNGSEASTRRYSEQAGVLHLVDRIVSCDDVGCSKPFRKVYETAIAACNQLEEHSNETELSSAGRRWFVAAHMWDLQAARKAGTALVLSEQPPLASDQLNDWWEMWGGKPDLVGEDLEELARQIIALSSSDKA